MRYGITRTTLNCNNLLNISPQEFEDAKDARRNLFEVLSIEEKLNIVLENFAEFEPELIVNSLNQMMFSGRNWSLSMDEIHKVNRRLINLLTTCRLYVDQIPHDLNSIYGDNSTQSLKVVQQMSQEYDTNLGYRVFSALRNYVQHRGLPIQVLNHISKRVEKSSGVFINHLVTVSIEVASLKEAGGFKTSVLKELEAVGKLIDIKPLLRQYIESIGRIHQVIRELLADDVLRWDNTILKIQRLYREAYNEEMLGLAIVAIDNSGGYAETLHIFDDPIKRRQWLMQKNPLIVKYSINNVTSEVETDDA